MRVRVWLCEALTGDVVREITSQSSLSISSRLDDRGSLSMDVRVDATSRDGSEPDWAEVRRRVAESDPLMYTVAVTSGTEVLTEHVIESWSATTEADSPLKLSGFSWERYPAYRSLHRDYIFSGTGRGALARLLLQGAFTEWNMQAKFTIPATTPPGTHAMDKKTRTAYYSDALREITEGDPGMEWVMRLTGTWSGDSLTRVTRAVEWGWPEIRRTSPIVLTAGAPGTRHGNAVLSGGRDGNRWAQSVYGVGPGQGDRQPFVGLSDPTRTNAGSLNSTKNLSFPEIDNMATLEAMTRQELELAQNLDLPFTATVEVDKLAAIPRVGDVVAVQCERTWAWPDGIDTTMRVGEVSYDIDGYHCEIVKLLVAED